MKDANMEAMPVGRDGTVQGILVSLAGECMGTVLSHPREMVGHWQMPAPQPEEQIQPEPNSVLPLYEHLILPE